MIRNCLKHTNLIHCENQNIINLKLTFCRSELTAFTRSVTLVCGNSLLKSLSDTPFGKPLIDSKTL